MRLYGKLLLVLVIIAQSCATSNNNQTYLIKNVNVITMNSTEVIRNTSVVVQNEKIVSVNKPFSGKAKTINGKGRWLIPGLIDMHVHNLADISFSPEYPTKGATIFTDSQDFLLLYLANGVTTAFELSARPEYFGLRNEVIKGKILGPRLALAFLINGEGSGNIATTPEEGRQTVRIAKAQGYEFIKVYSHLTKETFNAINDEAAKQHMKVVGHIPSVFRSNIEVAFVPNFSMVAHAEEFSKYSATFSNEDAERFAALAKKHKLWITPTLITMEWIARQTRSLDSLQNLPTLKYVHPLLQNKWLFSNNYHRDTSAERIKWFEDMAKFNLNLVNALNRAGVPIVAGTDAGTSAVVWGFSLHDELKLLVKAGLTPAEVLSSATRLPAEWLGIADKLGTIENGKFADLLLLNESPLENIGNTRKIAGVMVRGKWVSRKTINGMLKRLAKTNEANKNKYDWKKRKDY